MGHGRCNLSAAFYKGKKRSGPGIAELRFEIADLRQIAFPLSRKKPG
jgi:hypothetical protein